MEKIPCAPGPRTRCAASEVYDQMEKTVKISSWGVRGAFPTTDAAALDFGGNTSCYLVETKKDALILDAGSGLAALGKVWNRSRTEILLSHLHLDHVMGFFSFPTVFIPGKEVNLYGPPGFRSALWRLMDPPYWPVGFSDFPARVVFREVSPGEALQIGGFRVSVLEGNHPNGCLHYRLKASGRQIVYALDCELTADFAPKLAAFCEGADLLIWDANFVSGDLRPGWGHSTWEQGLELAKKAGVHKVLFTHYSRDYTSGFLAAQEELARAIFPDCVFAREGRSYTV